MSLQNLLLSVFAIRPASLMHLDDASAGGVRAGSRNILSQIETDFNLIDYSSM